MEPIGKSGNHFKLGQFGQVCAITPPDLSHFAESIGSYCPIHERQTIHD